MKKLTGHKHLNKLAKGALAMVLAGSFTFSASQAFAAETTTGQDQYQTVDLQSATNTDANSVTTTTQNQETPSLIPGDFFYFAKIAFEKIQFALTFDDVKEAKLLASFASERLAEAQALFASGNQDAAVQTIKQAIEDMKAADNKVDTSKESDSTSEQTNENTNMTDQPSTSTDETNTADSQTSAEQVKENQTTTNDTAEGDKQTAEIDNTVKQNIVALSAAMEKVKNPVAKAALQRNIEKSYAKLAKKLAKINKHSAKEDEETEQAPVTNEENSNPVSDPTVTTNVENGTTADVSAEQQTTVPVNEQQSISQTQEQKNHGQQATRQEVKQAAKQQITQKKEEMKTFIEEKKSEVKQKNEEFKGKH